MISRTVRVAAGTVAALAALTACSGESGGGTSPSSSAPASSPAAGSGPKVPAALPTDALLSDPCSVLTADGATQVGLALPGKKDTSSSQLTGCTWESTRSDQNSVAIYPLPQNKGGISDIYDQKAKDVYFQPVSIDGYPGVFADVQDGRPSGSCTLWVGITDQLAVSVIPSIGVGDNKNNPCGIAQKFATAMVGHLKGAA